MEKGKTGNRRGLKRVRKEDETGMESKWKTTEKMRARQQE